jgi:hypothetical protein
MEEKKKCTNCQQIKHIDSFVVYYTGNGNKRFRGHCVDCQPEIRRKAENKKKLKAKPKYEDFTDWNNTAIYML